MPRGKGFIDFPEFEQGYEALKLTTEGFQDMNPDKVMETVKEVPLSLIVLRSILGFTPPEWAYIASQQLGDNDSRGTVCPILPAATTIKRNPSLPQFRSGQSLSNALEYPQSKDRHYPQLEIHNKSRI